MTKKIALIAVALVTASSALLAAKAPKVSDCCASKLACCVAGAPCCE